MTGIVSSMILETKIVKCFFQFCFLAHRGHCTIRKFLGYTLIISRSEAVWNNPKRFPFFSLKPEFSLVSQSTYKSIVKTADVWIMNYVLYRAQQQQSL